METETSLALLVAVKQQIGALAPLIVNYGSEFPVQIIIIMKKHITPQLDQLIKYINFLALI